MSAEAKVQGRPLGPGQQFFLSFYWLSLNFHWGALLTVVISMQVLWLVGDAEKARVLGLLSAAGAFVAMITQPVVGALSDRARFKLGRRRPFVIFGTILNCLGLAAMAYAPAIAPLVAAFLLVQLTNNISGGAYQGLIPDLVPENQRGSASGWMGLMSMLGSIGGILVAGVFMDRHLVAQFYALTGGILILGAALTVWRVREQPLTDVPPFNWREYLSQFWVSPRKHPDFAWVFVARALVMLGFYTMVSFINYYLKDVLRIEHFAAVTSYVSGVVMIGAVFSTFLGGWLSDRVGRRGLVCVGSLLMGITCLAFLATRSLAVVYAFAVVFGIGYGVFISVDWALAIDVLPSLRTAGKDLGIWGIACTLPQVIGPLVGGQVIYAFQGISLVAGYQAVYLLGFVYLLLGSVFVWRIRGTR
jgi:MFS family permease